MSVISLKSTFMWNGCFKSSKHLRLRVTLNGEQWGTFSPYEERVKMHTHPPAQQQEANTFLSVSVYVCHFCQLWSDWKPWNREGGGWFQCRSRLPESQRSHEGNRWVVQTLSSRNHRELKMCLSVIKNTLPWGKWLLSWVSLLLSRKLWKLKSLCCHGSFKFSISEAHSAAICLTSTPCVVKLSLITPDVEGSFILALQIMQGAGVH